MVLTARVAATGERIAAADFESGHVIRIKYQKDQLISPYPDCDTPVFVRDRGGFTLHFVHKTAPVTNFNYHPESVEHLRGKQLIAEAFRAELAGVSDAEVTFEYPIGDRIADVAIIYPTGWVKVGECQLAAITTDELEQRTQDYAEQGCDVIWWLGKDADTTANRNWCVDKFGDCKLINYHAISERAEWRRAS